MAKKDIIEKILNVNEMFTKSELEGKKIEELEKLYALSLSLNQKEKEIEEAKKQEEKMKEQEGEKKSTEMDTDEVKDNSSTYQRIKKPTLDKNELIPVMNITNGPLIYQSKKTGMEIKFEKYGDVEYLEVGELLTMRSGQRRFLDEPWIFIMDDEVTEYLGLDKLYKKLVNPSNIDQIFNFNVDHFTEVIKSSPRGYAQLLISRAKEKIKNGSLDSVAKIKALEERFNIELVQ
jgi:hypothetical protein